MIITKELTEMLKDNIVRVIHNSSEEVVMTYDPGETKKLLQHWGDFDATRITCGMCYTKDGDMTGCIYIRVDTVVQATFVTVYTSGTVVKSPCKVNLSTRQVFDIKSAGVVSSERIVDQHILLNETPVPVRPILDVKHTAIPDWKKENHGYWYE